MQRTRSMTVETLALDDDLDTRFKPGFQRQLAAFLTDEGADALLQIEAHAEDMSVYGQILSGTGGRALEWAPAPVRA